MANPFRDLFFGQNARTLVQGVVPRRTFDDVVLPPATRRSLELALTQIRNHDLIFRRWGLGERHETGTGLAFNFAGPPGTGKTICAEAIAHALGKRLLVVSYAEVESQWAGATGKNVVAVFRAAAESDAVLFFDEADAIAGRRSTSLEQGYQREANTVVSILLRELEQFSGVVVFATNLAANFDPAFERRIRHHILFEMPGPREREAIWRVQLHEGKTPLDEDVDFHALAERYEVSGGDIKNAVLKAAQIAASEPVPDGAKRIHQRHFEEAMEEVLVSRSVMEQSVLGASADPLAALWGARAAGTEVAEAREEMREGLVALGGRVGEVEDALGGAVERLERSRAEAEARTSTRLEALEAGAGGRERLALVVSGAALAASLAALLAALLG